MWGWAKQKAEAAASEAARLKEQARALAQRVDFLSVGTNDLTQYLLAVDRNNRQVSDLYNSFHPAVLHALLHVVEQAHEEGKPVSVCGEMAGDPASALLIMAMGYDALSMNASNLLRVKAAVRQVNMGFLRRLLNEWRCTECVAAVP